MMVNIDASQNDAGFLELLCSVESVCMYLRVHPLPPSRYQQNPSQLVTTNEKNLSPNI